MSDSLNNEQRELLLTAYFDNELGPEDRARVELMLVENPSYAQLLQQWRENGDAIRKLPRFSLDDGFAARVLAATVVATGQHQINPNETKVQVFVNAESEANSWRIGLGAIMTLAAMLFLTLFVFPTMIDSNVAVLQPGSGDAISPQAVINEPEPGEVEKRQPVIVSRKSSLTGATKNGRPVDPIALESFHRPNVEQVLWIEDTSLGDLETVLANHSIRLVDPSGDIRMQLHLVPQDDHGLEALYVVSTIERMKQAVADLSGESSGTVRAFPLPGGSSSSGETSTEQARFGNGVVQQIASIDLSQNGTDASEIASLDKWFGLAADVDESRIVRFLLLVNTPSEVPAKSVHPAPSER